MENTYKSSKNSDNSHPGFRAHARGKLPKGRMERITHRAEVSEKAIEKYLVGKVGAIGGICLKYSNPCMAGYPDRLVCLPHGRTVWVELKSRGRKPTRIQSIRHRELEGIGHEVHVIDCKERVDELIRTWEDEI